MKEGFITSKRETQLSGPRLQPHYVRGDTGGDVPDKTQSGLRLYRYPEWVPDDVSDRPISDTSEFRDPKLSLVRPFGRSRK